MHSHDPDRTCWDQVYMTRSRRYGGAPPELPPLPAGSLVLEVGCGDGKTLRAMDGLDWKVVAMDFSRPALLGCLHTRSLAQIPFVLSDAACLPFREASFAAVFLSHVVSHAHALRRTHIAEEAGRVLRQGGSVFFRDFSIEDMRAETGVMVEPGTRLRGDGISTHYFTLQEAEALFPSLNPVDITVRKWAMRLKGERCTRAEVYGQFLKGDPAPEARQ